MNPVLKDEDYLTLARAFVSGSDPTNARLGRRYISVLRRAVILKQGVEMAHRRGREKNPLSFITFTPPLSVAGCNSEIIVRAEWMKLRYIPVETEFNEHGDHAGTTIDMLRDSMAIAGVGREFTDQQILGFYRRWMESDTPALQFHALSRFSKIPGMLNRVVILRRYIEGELKKSVLAKDRTRFIIVIDRQMLHSHLKAIQSGRKYVLVGYNGGQKVLFDGLPVPCEGNGAGAAMLLLKDLHAAGAPGCPAVWIKCESDRWFAGTGEEGETVQEFGYYRKKQK